MKYKQHQVRGWFFLIYTSLFLRFHSQLAIDGWNINFLSLIPTMPWKRLFMCVCLLHGMDKMSSYALLLVFFFFLCHTFCMSAMFIRQLAKIVKSAFKWSHNCIIARRLCWILLMLWHLWLWIQHKMKSCEFSWMIMTQNGIKSNIFMPFWQSN